MWAMTSKRDGFSVAGRM